jgi:hypothetical protein
MKKLSTMMVLVLGSAALISGCGKKGDGKGQGALAGIDSNGRCIPSTLAPFGRNFPPLNASQRKQVYELVKEMEELKDMAGKAALIALEQTPSAFSNPFAQKLIDAKASGACQGGSTSISFGMQIAFDGAACPVSVKHVSKVEPARPDRKEIISSKTITFKINDRTIAGVGSLTGFENKTDVILNAPGDVRREAFATCYTTQGTVQTTDLGTVQEYTTSEAFSARGLNDGVQEARTRRGLKLPAFAVEFVSDLSLSDVTINGVSVDDAEVDAAGLTHTELTANIGEIGF